MNTAQRRDLRQALILAGFSLATYTPDNGDGAYEEIWDDVLKFNANATYHPSTTMVRISWGEKEKD